ncbi:conserved hypothetical protein, membrane [Candidatus Magnetobacterium bavaricum]|uniref:DUF2905 domain-containing protein n=1 Tax=Candidatus Magnetobacterium bavaricum TaxID=29290 RepID=A0A0F3GQX0_9BACT|nr:conserved hypothetical protein, membrane [Candidatus Magnetobacterium bavaricum]
MEQIGKTLLILGILTAVIGGVILLGGKLPYIGRLPGDIVIQKKNFTLYFPLATSIIISVLLTVFFMLTGKK